ncbi:MAG: hypothetical protein AAGK22_25500 [Acidobacteriota bacterium]
MTQAELVAPTESSRETVAVFVAALLILALAAGLVFARRSSEPVERLHDWQISAFHDLSGPDQAIYNALLTASDELWWLHNDMLAYSGGDTTQVHWPTIEQLETYYVVPPFPRDAAAAQNGNVQWQRAATFTFEGATVYFGNNGTIPGQSAYLLVLTHAHKGASYTNIAQIWTHTDAAAPMPKAVKRDSLILDGWREVVPYTGAMELERLRAG